MDHETLFVRAFIVPAKRRRIIELLKNPKRRGDVLAELYHFRDLDPRFMVAIEPAQQTAHGIAALLGLHGAPSTCHVISTDDDLDGRNLLLADALEQIIASGGGTLVSCIPGQLGYFEGEGPKDRCLLLRPETLRG